jgi:hypothetical protein
MICAPECIYAVNVRSMLRAVRHQLYNWHMKLIRSSLMYSNIVSSHLIDFHGIVSHGTNCQITNSKEVMRDHKEEKRVIPDRIR